MILGKEMVCETCLFWQKVKHLEYGLCRFSAPIFSKTDIQGIAIWPRTMPEDWCADFKCNSELEAVLREQAKKEAAEFGKIIGDKIREATAEPVPEEEKN